MRDRVAPPSKQMAAARERLTFGGERSVPGRGLVEAALAREELPTFATASFAEPRDWGYGGLMAFTAVLLLRPQDTLPFLDPLHLAELFAIVGIAPMILHRLTKGLPVFRITPETTALMAFGAVIIGTIPFSIWPSGAFDTAINAYLKIVIVFVLMTNTLTTTKRIDRLIWVILLCFGYVAGRAVLDYARGINLVENDRLAGPVGGIFGNPNDLALNMVTFLPVAVLAAMNRADTAIRRAAAALIAVMMLAVVIFTKSRGGLLGLVAMIMCLAPLTRRIRPGLGGAVLVAVLIAAPFMPQSFWTRMSSIFDDEQDRINYSGSREARRTLMEEGIKAFVDNPLTGVGAGQFRNYNPPGRREPWRDVHNAFIQVAADTGVFGLVAYLFLILRAVILGFRTRKLLGISRRPREPAPLDTVFSAADRRLLHQHTAALTAGMAGWLVCALFAPVAYSWTFYYALALLAAAHGLTHIRIAAAARAAVQHSQRATAPLRYAWR